MLAAARCLRDRAISANERASMNELLRREIATTATLEKYRDAEFSWLNGKTCLHLCRFHLRKMGHRPPPLPRIRSAIGARRALDANGWADVGEMMDSLLPRIAPAQMLLGDIAMLKSEDGFGALVVSLGAKVMGWHDDAPGLTALEVLEFAGAWRA